MAIIDSLYNSILIYEKCSRMMNADILAFYAFISLNNLDLFLMQYIVLRPIIEGI